LWAGVLGRACQRRAGTLVEYYCLIVCRALAALYLTA